ncbi:interferon-induced very large GTPase 1-like [Ruditapes philippinarum]|uniref:interferon-induced very large GTPase 1-like n=1 Tax=Ruditapes philippinarum TaxID=129788 RepID=UPI00295C0371|nr:interferon-induced very large GTPase 1-like [Ruditapes philippinarum]
MGVDLQTYRGRIGTFKCTFSKDVVKSQCHIYFSDSIKCIGSFIFVGLLLVMAGIESNPGPWTIVPDDLPETKSVFVSGLPDDFETDYVEFTFSKRYGKVTDVRVDADRRDTLVITFQDSAGLESVRKAEPIKINQNTIDVQPFYANVVIVRGLSSDLTTRCFDELQTFLEQEAGGGTVNTITPDCENNCAYVVFKNDEGAKTVIRKGALIFQKHSLTASYVHEKNTYITDCSPSDQKLEIGSDEESVRSTHFNYILQKCGLEKEYPNKIKVRDVVALDLIKEDSKQMISYKDLPWTLLRGLINVNSDARDHTMNADESKQTDDDILEIDDDSNDELSPLDVFHVVFQCCNSMLQELLFQKLYLCKRAVPFIHIRYQDNLPCAAIWPLRSLKIHSKLEISEPSSKFLEIGVLDIPCNVVTVARIGRPDFSKSTLINELLSDNENKVFYNQDCNKGKTKRFLSGGSVDMFWLPVVPDRFIFEKAITFLNIRGDFDESRSDNIKEFTMALTDCLLIVLDIETIVNDKHSFQCILTYFTSHRIILVIVGPIIGNSKIKCLKDLNDNWKKKAFDIRLVFTHPQTGPKNVLEISKDVSCKLKAQLEGFEAKSLENRISSKRMIKTDEEDEHCLAGRKYAEELFTSSNINYDIKQPLERMITPFYSSASKELGSLMKSLQRAKNEKERSKHVKAITCTKEDQLKRVPNFVVEFTKCLSKLYADQLRIYFFLSWINIFFQKKGKAWHMPVEDTFKYDYILREIGYIYDALISLRKNPEDYELPPPKQIAETFSTLFIDGYPLELIEGDNFYLPSEWINLVLGSVSKTTKGSKILSLSILGVQSSGKSTFLNTMFGSQFSASSGRCTRGIHMQLIPVNSKPISSLSPFDSVLVLDTEGLRAPELYNGMYEHDNELATIVTGIGDISMINILGENAGEIHEVLQVIVHAFLRLKIANENLDIFKCCYFIHQNVTGATAREKREQALKKLTTSLDIATKEAADLQGITDLNSFNDIIEFEMSSGVWYLSNLWQGIFPMASVNTEYSSQVRCFRKELLEKALEIRHKSYKSITEIALHINELWKGVLSEDFLFSFRSNLELKAHVQLSEEMDRHKFEMENIMHQTVTDLFRNQDSVQIEDDCLYSPNKFNESLRAKLNEEESAFLNKICEYFEASEYRKIIYPWKDGTLECFKMFCRQLLDQSRFECLKMYENMKVYKWTQKIDNVLKDRLFAESVKLAQKMRETDFKPDDKNIRKRFNEIWELFSTPYLSESLKQNDIELSEIFKNALYDIFSNDKALLRPHLEKKDFTYLETKLKGTFDDLDIRQTGRIRVRFLNDIVRKISGSEITVIKEHIEQLFDRIDTKLKFYCLEETNITKQAVRHFLSEIKDMMTRFKTENVLKFHLDKTMSIQIFIHISRRTMYLFEKQQQRFVETIQSRVTELKFQAEKFFFSSLDERKKKEQALLEMKRIFTTSCRETVEISLAISVKKELNKKLPTSKVVILREAMKSLVESSKFECFQEYINCPNMYLEKWISKKVTHIFASGKDSKQDIYFKAASELIQIQVQKIRQAVQKSPCDSVDSYVEGLIENLKSEGIIIDSLNSVKQSLNNQNNADLESFKDSLITNLVEIESSLTEQFAYVDLNDVKWRGLNPILEIIKKATGCPEQCPYCAEPCILDLNHDRKHVCFRHKPKGCRGIHTLGWKSIILSTCSLDVKSSKKHSCEVFSFKCNEGEERACPKQFHSYSHYKKHFPSWDIGTSDTTDNCTIWKWYIVKFRKELYDKGLDLSRIPLAWADITVSDVLLSLEVIDYST